MVKFPRRQIAELVKKLWGFLSKVFDEKALKASISQKNVSVTLVIYHESFFKFHKI